MSDLNYVENENLTQFKQEERQIYQQILCFIIVKQLFLPNLGLSNPKISKIKFFRQSRAKDMGKIPLVKQKPSLQAKP